jgi:cytoskeletal protein CcmA (bactofilin family)
LKREVTDMANERMEYEAMVVPRGARIHAGDGGRIELDVQGDLILQESQQGLTSLNSRHGSILIDNGVTVRSSSIRAEHMIRIRGRLETDEISAASISLENGALICGEINTTTLNSSESDLTVKAVEADQVKISGGEVEVGAISSRSLFLENKVRGAILISAAEDRRIDDTVQVKGGFESDVELLGYLLKYRRQILSDRVLKELKSREEGREFRRYLLHEAGAEAEERAEEEVVIEMEPPEMEEEPAAEASEIVLEPEDISRPPTEAAPLDETDRLSRFAAELSASVGDELQAPRPIKLILANLYEADLEGLRADYALWMNQLEADRARLSAETLGILEDLRKFLESSEN